MKITDIIDSKEYLPAPAVAGEGISKPSQLTMLELSDEEIAEYIRPEANLEAWQSFLFPHPKAKGLTEERSKSVPVTLPDGRDATGKITVIPAVGRTSTTSRSYDVYLALVAIWNSRGLPDEPVQTSVREIVRTMGVPENGKWYDIVIEECEKLFVTTTTWVLSFSGEKKYESVKYQKVLDTFAYAKLEERAEEGDEFQKILSFRLSEKIRENHLRNNTNPILWSVRKSITSAVGRVFYSQIDRALYKREKYERTGENLVVDLMLSETRYRYKSKRLELLQKLAKQIDGKTLSNLRTVRVYVVETNDKSDYKILATVGKSKALSQSSNLPVLNNDKAYIDAMIDRIDEAVGGKNSHSKLYKKFVRHYSETHIMRAIGEYKEAKNYLSDKSHESKQKHFTVIMHRLAHRYNRSWIKNCGSDCPHREQNKLI